MIKGRVKRSPNTLFCALKLSLSLLRIYLTPLRRTKYLAGMVNPS